MCIQIVLEFKNCDDFEKIVMCPVYESQDQAMKNYAEHILQTYVNTFFTV